jgi:hypothetical protein
MNPLIGRWSVPINLVSLYIINIVNPPTRGRAYSPNIQLPSGINIMLHASPLVTDVHPMCLKKIEIISRGMTIIIPIKNAPSGLSFFKVLPP